MSKKRSSREFSNEELVQYLDGEMHPDRSEDLETALGQDRQLRERIAEFDQTWDLLGALDAPRLTPEFTAQTLATIQQDVAQTSKTLVRPSAFLVTVGLWVAGVTTSAVIGFQIGQTQARDELQQLQRDLPIIRRLEFYRDVGDAKYAKHLQESELFEDD